MWEGLCGQGHHNRRVQTIHGMDGIYNILGIQATSVALQLTLKWGGVMWIIRIRQNNKRMFELDAYSEQEKDEIIKLIKIAKWELVEVVETYDKMLLK